ncbi:MAG: ribosome biogenesis GTPase YlqF [Erysipelotrichaceae bacterium]
MNQKRELRKKKAAENKPSKININWFPGHMTKAKRQMEESLKQVDLVIEILDARVPLASKNPLIDELINQKPRLVILSKKDLADDSETKKWINYWSNEHTIVISLNFNNDNLNIINEKCMELMKEKIERQIRKGIKPRANRAMVVGIPNVGKSTLINRLAKKKVANVADKPGVTRALQWVKVSNELELLDTPGVLWPKFEDENTGILLAVTGAINDQILDKQFICHYAYQYLIENYFDKLQKRYDISNDLSFDDFILQLGKYRGFLVTKGEVDLERTYIVFLDEIRSSYFNGVTWQKTI